MVLNKEDIAKKYTQLQDQICHSLEQLDGSSRFKEDKWTRAGGGGGITRIIENGDLIEKGGVNFSAVHGKAPEVITQQFRSSTDQFFATGVSIVLHPQNPFAPIIHMNIRYFELDDEVWWFGGGIDVTPHYLDLEGAKQFHLSLKSVCDQHDKSFYPKFKKWADDYFFISHRNETRGIGGIFFDRLSTRHDKPDLLDFTLDIGSSFAPIYEKLVSSKRDVPFDDNQRNWQLIRRGRYVEFNLVLDRGTKFGLESDGRIESILMSLPPLASWKYNYIPANDSPEHIMLQHLRKDIDWINA